MKIYANQLDNHLNQGLVPVYLIFGDEPFQVQQARQSIKKQAKQQGFEEVIRLVDDDQFDWQSLYQHCQSMSLFAEKKIIEIELYSNKVAKEKSDVLLDISSQLGDDVILLLFGGKLDSNQTKAKWFKTLDKLGLFIPVYEIEGQHLQRWLQQQMQINSVGLDRDAQQLLINYCAGNLLACAQELQKLALLFPNSNISSEQLENTIHDQSRFTVFQLADELLKQNANNCIHILSQLKIEEVEPAIILWSIKKELLTIHALQVATQFNQPIAEVFSKHKVWKNKQSNYQMSAQKTSHDIVQQCIKLIAEVDLIHKSDSAVCCYTLLSHICLLFCGAQLDIAWQFPSIEEF